MRTVMINTISEDYVTMAHAKGLREQRVMTQYAGRNAILPPLNGFAAQFASAVGGLVFIENIFSYPGSATRCRTPSSGTTTRSLRGSWSFSALCVIVANLIMDILNLVLDPRLRTS